MVVQSRYPDLDLPSVDVFTFLFERKDRLFPDTHGETLQAMLVLYTNTGPTAIFRDGLTNNTYSYGDVRRLALQFGRGLTARYDWRRGDVLAISSLNDVDMPPVVFGALWAGATVSTSNPGYTAPELTYQLKNSGARCVVTQHGNLDMVQKACRAAGIPQSNIIILGHQEDRSAQLQHWSSICSLGSGKDTPACKIDPQNDAAFLVYSSGTTGKPKGVRLTHYNITSNVLQLQVAEGNNLTWDGSHTVSDIPLPKAGSGGDKILACLPFFHIYGLTVLVLSPVYSGVTTVVMPRFNVDKWCHLVQKHGITYSYIVPPIALHLAKHPSVSSYDLSSLRMTQSGAAPLTRELIEQVENRVNIRIKQGYGLSETSPCLYQGVWEEWKVDSGSCGALLPNLEAKICAPVDDSDPGNAMQDAQELEPGMVGELYVRGPNVFKGYHDNAEATADCLSGDGWFRTGDIGYFTARGNLFVTDRVKELIKYNGFQVPPAELEGYLLEFPGIVDCAVIGVFDKEKATEVPRAYLVTEPGSKELDTKGLHAWFNSRVANYKRLRGGVRLVRAIPKNASGKILRKELRVMANKEAGIGTPKL